MDPVSIAQVPQWRSVDVRTSNNQRSAHPIFSRPISPPSPLSNRRSTPAMRANGDPFSANQYARLDLRDNDVSVGAAIFASESPATMRITSSSYGSTSFSIPFQRGRQHLRAQPPTELYASSAPINLPYRSSSPRAPAAPGYSGEGINDLGDHNSDRDSDDIDDSSCMLFETTINGDNCMPSEVVSRYGDSSNHGFASPTKISRCPSSTCTTGSGHPMDEEDECDANIFDSFIPVYGRPAAAPPAVASCATPQPPVHTRPAPSLQTFGIPELVSDVSAGLIRIL
jgi:hypothetical protein